LSRWVGVERLDQVDVIIDDFIPFQRLDDLAVEHDCPVWVGVLVLQVAFYEFGSGPQRAGSGALGGGAAAVA
jgi:hypothetical protein